MLRISRPRSCRRSVTANMHVQTLSFSWLDDCCAEPGRHNGVEIRQVCPSQGMGRKPRPASNAKPCRAPGKLNLKANGQSDGHVKVTIPVASGRLFCLRNRVDVMPAVHKVMGQQQAQQQGSWHSSIDLPLMPCPPTTRAKTQFSERCMCSSGRNISMIACADYSGPLYAPDSCV